MSLAIGLIMIGAGVCALASLIDSVSRIPALLDALEEDRQRLANVTHYNGPAYTRHGRQIEGN
jgi:hypothetical protein